MKMGVKIKNKGDKSMRGLIMNKGSNFTAIN